MKPMMAIAISGIVIGVAGMIAGASSGNFAAAVWASAFAVTHCANVVRELGD